MAGCKNTRIEMVLLIISICFLVAILGCSPTAQKYPETRLKSPNEPVPLSKAVISENPPPDSLEIKVNPKEDLPGEKIDTEKPGEKKEEDKSPATPDNQKYLLRRGDEIEISVQGFPEMTRKIPIRPDGWISYSHVNEIKASGRTIGDLQKELQEKMSKFINDPRVTVIGISFVPDKVSIIGQVKTPGVYSIERATTVLELLAKSGGIQFPQDAVGGSSTVTTSPNLKGTYILRAEGNQCIPVDLDKLLNEKDISQNKIMHHRDVLYIPPADENKIFVLGEVKSPKVISFSRSISFVEAMTQAGGLDFQGRNRSVYLVRGSLTSPQVYRINAYDIVKGKRSNFILKPHDILYVGPTGLTKWQNLLSQIVPSLTTALTADSVAKLK